MKQPLTVESEYRNLRKRITVFTTLGGSQNMLVLQRSVPNRNPGTRRLQVVSRARACVRAHRKLKGHATRG